MSGKGAPRKQNSVDRLKTSPSFLVKAPAHLNEETELALRVFWSMPLSFRGDTSAGFVERRGPHDVLVSGPDVWFHEILHRFMTFKVETGGGFWIPYSDIAVIIIPCMIINDTSDLGEKGLPWDRWVSRHLAP